MSSKRNLKKQIRYACGDIAGECIISSMVDERIDRKQMEAVVIKVAELQTSCLEKTNITFDKTPKDFDSIVDYRKAHRHYFAKAFASLRETFNKSVEEIVKEMNKALPKDK